jgi:hypothetical protein
MLAILDKCKIILFEAAIYGAALGRFTAFAMINVYRKVSTGIPVNPTIITFTAIDEKFMFIHGITSLILQPFFVDCRVNG